VGSGPFPTELFDATGDEIRRVGHEFGAVTGRPRRTGWLDLVALRYAVMVDGVTDLVMMKADCLDGFDTIKICTSYKINGVETSDFPSETDAPIEPVYTEFPGWKQDLCGVTDPSVLPKAFNDYVAFIESATGVPVSIVSLGPDRDTIIER
jgi:adenylosuccinate synthase